MRLILTTISILALLLIAVIVGPNFVDWNKYKPEIVRQVKTATGLDIKLDGNLSMGIIPSPHLKIQNVTLVAPVQKNFENLLTMKEAEVSVELGSLMKKEIKVSSVLLDSPDIQIEIMANGTPSWTTDKVQKAEKAAEVAEEGPATTTQQPKKDVLESVALDSLEIINGKLSYVDHQKGTSQNLEAVNVKVSANSLKGPFALKGNLIYDGKKIAMDVTTGKMPKDTQPLEIKGDITLPDATASMNFKGVSIIKAPYEVQGQTNISIQNPAQFTKATGISLGGLKTSLGLDGLITANDNKIAFDNLKLSLGNFIGNGKITVGDIKSRNPLTISGSIQSTAVLNLNDILSAPVKKQANLKGNVLIPSAHAQTAGKNIIPSTLALPMPVDVDFKLDVGGIKYQSYDLEGVFIDINKVGKSSKIAFKAMEIPGQAKADGTLAIDYASVSQGKNGQVVYSEPTVSYAVNGQAAQLETFLKTAAPQADMSAVTKLYKTAQFTLKGGVSGSTISLKDSVLKLDDMVVGLGGSYRPAANGGRAKATIDLTANYLNLDQFKSGGSTSSSKTEATASPSATASGSKQTANPLKNLSLPLDLGFDVSLQKARMNGMDVAGVRLVGEIIGQSLALQTASVNDLAGAAVSVKGKIANFRELSGIDAGLYIKTDNLANVGKALKLDLSKLPEGINALEAQIDGKGSADQMGFNAAIKALGGQVEAAGVVSSLLVMPSYTLSSLGLQHPNAVKALQIVNPSFKGQAGLQQPISFHTKADINGKQYNLTDMKVSLGKTDFAGNLSINAGVKPVSVRGAIAAGQIALDDLLGAKKAGGGTSSASASSSSGGASSGGGKWSSAPIDLSWMNTLDVAVDLKASSITYGGWNFTNPSTDLKIGGGQMVINGMKAGVFGGNATLSTQVKANPVSLSVQSNMDSIDLEKLVKALSGSGKLKSAGTVSFDMDVQGAGGSAKTLVASLGGKANLKGSNIVIKGFDLVKLSRGLATDEKMITSAASLVDGALSGGETRFDTLLGNYTITGGEAKIDTMYLDSEEARIDTTGSADLNRWYLMTQNKITLKKVTDLDPFNVEIKGPLDNPKQTFGTNILENYVKDKIKRKLAKELPDVLGEDVTDKLKQFGILPQDKKAEPVPTPAPVQVPVPEATPDAAAPAEVAPAPVQEQTKKIEKPEDAINELLKSGSPEDAVNDIIKGLF